MKDVVYITVDSLRADHVGWHGYERETTPNLDAVASTAHTFSNAFAHACFTRQSFPAIMTAKLPSECREGQGLSEDCTTIAQTFSDAGYATAAFHSNTFLLEEFGYARGFDAFFDSEEETSYLAKLRQWVKNTLPKESRIYRFLQWAFEKSEESTGFNPGNAYTSADRLTDKAIDWVQREEESPRFLWIHYMDVHHPYTPPETHQRAFRDDPISKRQAIKLRRRMVDEPQDLTDEELADIIDLYDAEIRYVDAEVDRLIDAVRSNWGDETLIAFTADHGDEFLDHGSTGHGRTMYDELLHVPLFITADGGGSHNDEIVGLIDVPPTLFDLAGAEIPEVFDGTSVSPLLGGEDTGAHRHVIADHGEKIAYRDSQWKYITGPGGSELYDLTADPGEQTNVIDSHEDVVAEITETLAEYPQLGTAATDEFDAEDISGEVQDRLEQLGYLDE